MAFANVILRTNPTDKYGGGDHMHVYNWKAILAKNAEHICFRRRPDRRFAGLTTDGLLPSNGIAMVAFESTREYRFNRVGVISFTITKLSTGEVSDVFQGVSEIRLVDGKRKSFGVPFENPFTGKSEFMDLKLFMNRRMTSLQAKNATGLPVFGQKGFEFWYGGGTDVSSAAISRVWDGIEERTPHIRTQSKFRRMPGIENLSLSNNTVIEIDNIPDRAVVKLEEPLYDPATVGPGGIQLVDENGDVVLPVMIKARRHRTRFEDALGMTAEEIARAKNKQDYFDHRTLRNHSSLLFRGAMRRKRMNDSEIEVPGDILD